MQDYTNEGQMEHCRLAGLLDLNQTDPVAGPAAAPLLAWITDLVQARKEGAVRVLLCKL